MAITFFGVISIGFWGYISVNVNAYNPMWIPFILVLFIFAFGKKIEEDRIFIMSEGPIGFVNIEALKGDAQ